MASTPSQTEPDREEVLKKAVLAHAARVAGFKRGTDAHREQTERAEFLLTSPLLSIRNVARVTGFGNPSLQQRAPKMLRQGGRLVPETLPMILDLVNAERVREGGPLTTTSVELVAKILGGGTSARVLERLSGIPETTLRRWAEIAKVDS